MGVSKKFLILGVIYTFVYILLATGAAGFGHGTYVFFLIGKPYGLGFLFFPIVFLVLPILAKSNSTFIFITVMIFHYLVVLLLFGYYWNVETADYFYKTWNLFPVNIILPVGWYIVGNIFLWTAFIFKLRNNQFD